MGEEKRHINYSGADIQKYLSGKLSPAEMYEMEKAALDDAFLAEAIEGYASLQEKGGYDQLAILQGNFSAQAKVTPIRRPSFKIWKAAAAVLIIASGVAVTYTLITRKNTTDNTIAAVSIPDSINRNEEKITSNASGDNDTTIGQQYKFSVQDNVKVSKPNLPLAKDRIYVSSKKENKLLIQDREEVETNDMLKSRTDLPITSAAPALEAPQMQNEVAEKRMTEITESKSLNKNIAFPLEKDKERPFIGQVVAIDNTPLPFAHIRIPRNNARTYADARGNFKLVAPDSILNVEIKSAGYISRSSTLNTNILYNKIVLDEDKLGLNQRTIIIGNGAKLKKKQNTIFEPDSISHVEPEDGWDSYDTYIANNISLPDETVQNNIHGEVEVSFDVQRNGAISNLRIEKSLCAECDKEALRIIKEGPQWRVKKGKKATAKVKVNF